MDNPSGALMVQRTEKVKDQVKAVLQEWPSTRGNDTLMIYRLVRKYYPQIRISAKQFEDLMLIPSFETMRRRRQELQVEFEDLRPTARTQRKRFRRATALKHYYGKGLTLGDFFSGDE